MPAHRKGRPGRCRDCDAELTDENWLPRDRADKKYVCRSCKSASARRSAERNPNLADEQRARSLKRKYGLTVAEYEALLEAQGGVCALCERPQKDGRRLAVDHDPRTGRVRGLLCSKCNGSLGTFGDDEDGILRVLDYLRARPKLRVVA